MHHINLPGFQPGKDLTSLHNPEIDFRNFRRSLKIIFIRMIGNIMCRIVIIQEIRPVHNVRMAEPAVRQKLIVRNIFNGMFGKNAHPGRHIIQERIKGHVILTDKLQILVIRLMDSLDFRCSFR